jgi:hypothetical protein
MPLYSFPATWNLETDDKYNPSLPAPHPSPSATLIPVNVREKIKVPGVIYLKMASVAVGDKLHWNVMYHSLLPIAYNSCCTECCAKKINDLSFFLSFFLS